VTGPRIGRYSARVQGGPEKVELFSTSFALPPAPRGIALPRGVCRLCLFPGPDLAGGRPGAQLHL